MSAFCSGLCNEISRCCYDFAHAPFTKKNLMIGGGVLLGLIIIIIIIVAASSGTKAGPTAQDLIQEYPLIDGANSIAFNLKQQLLDRIESVKNGLASRKDWEGNCTSCQTDIDSFIKGHVATQVFSVTSYCDAQYKDAVSQTLEQIDVIKRLMSSSSKKKMALVLQSSDIIKYFKDKKMGVILNVWGGHNIDSRLAVLRMYYDLGVRMMALVAADPDTGKGCLPPWVDEKNNSLTQFGVKVINEMNRLGMMIDLTGSPQPLQESVLGLTKAEVIYSHSGANNITANSLNVQDGIIKAHKKQIGVIMVPFTPSQLDSKANSTLTSVAEHLDKLYDLLEDTTKLGIGSNFDNMSKVTTGLEDVSHFINLVTHLKDRKTPKGGVNWDDEEIKRLISFNFIKMFERVEKVKNDTMKPDDTIMPASYYTDSKVNETCYSDFKLRYPNATSVDEPNKKPDNQTHATDKPTVPNKN